MRRLFKLAIFLPAAMGLGCELRNKAEQLSPQTITTAWADMTLYVTKNTPANSPTYASRVLAYIGLTMYESIVQGFPTHNTLRGQLNGLDSIPTTQEAEFDWMLSLNAGQALIIKRLYNQTSDENKIKIDSLERYFQDYLSDARSAEVTKRSIAYGQAVAEAIFRWSLHDGGHRGYLANFDKAYRRDKTPGCWEPPLYGQAISHFPLHPRWGENRNFLVANRDLQLPLMVRYDPDSLSDYYKENYAVFEKNQSLTQDEKEAALWWGDDPGETFTPPGHSYYLATLVIRKQNPDLITCAETYARVGLAVGDAFINCWRWKYHFYSERPSSFINLNIDQRWEAFWPDPPFPAFPSGHATQAAAVAKVLADLYGENFEFTDDAHASRPRDRFRNVDFKPRTFKTFWSVAEETANSRFYGGIHTQQDNRIGLQEGAKIGNNVNNLHWLKEEIYAKN